MRSRRNVTLVFGARGHLGQSGCEDPVESLESCLYHARLASRRTTQSSIGGDPEGHPCRAYTVSYFKHETSSRISYLEIYLSSPNREAGETRLGLQQGRRGSATQKRAARLHTRTRLTRGEDWTRRFGFGFGRAGVERLRVRSSAGGTRGGSASSGGCGRRLGADRSGSLRLDRSDAADGASRIDAADGASRIDAALRASATQIGSIEATRRGSAILLIGAARRRRSSLGRSGAAGSGSAGGCGFGCRRAEDGSASTRLADARWVGSTTGGSEG
ncbi:hypothetical protein E6C27_scaffold511G00630 [Cucumis melo var. makuwa]|uniref:Uncharacterized protein n=1 Tax=Cucumis melo var. makuwa TaxID=1194695 RepID=A0A5A7UA93_CUCMM|nr:hypothetical protein E6C27_scaffold511G00630 [Cucumis melo var. makuwa]